ncbi:MAG TPA: Flp pilus assembly protein CpaB [Roseiarcus sp.]|jgi:pilus assembly protein CpaB
MNKVQIAVLGATVIAFGAAYLLFNTAPAPAPQAPRVVQAPKLETDDVLIAAQDLPMGTPIGDASVAWAVWPKKAISENMIVKSSGPNVMEDVKGSMTRDDFMRGEPMRRDKLVKGANGFMSAILPAGKRAVAIKVDNGGDAYAGGFILPNDRVDVVTIYHDDEATKARGVAVIGARTILANVRVLAIGQNIQEENGKKVVVGANATLELDPSQAEMVILAQQTGNANLHLVLRSLADSSGPTETVGDVNGSGVGGNNLTIVRYGESQTAAR